MQQNEPAVQAPEQVAARIDAALAKGDLFIAHDLALAGVAQFPDSALLKHRVVLALARLGAAQQAQARYDRWNLGQARTGDRQLDIDLGALGGRLLKDQALAAKGYEQIRLFVQAAERYQRVFEQSRDAYPGTNAAALYLWAGHIDRAQMLAQEALDRARGGGFYAEATRAECELILGNPAAAKASLERAIKAGGDAQAHATLRRQLRMTCERLRIDDSILSAVGPKPVIRFLGHMIGKRFPAELEPQATPAIAALLDEIDASIGYGALACGADILFAEALVERGGELNVVLPFAVDDFKRVSVAIGGEAWLSRFDRCLARAHSLRFASSDLYLGDDSLFKLCSEFADGLAVMRGKVLDTPVVQLAIWDGAPAAGVGGAGDDIARWHALGLPQRLLDPCGQAVAGASMPELHRAASGKLTRELHPVVFGDFAGFGRLNEKQVAPFIEGVFGALAKTLEAFAASIVFRNTWGDGLFLVFDGVLPAAEAALALQQTVSSLNYGELKLAAPAALRLCVHFGPVMRLNDPITKRETWTGAQVSQTSRIEPIVPPGLIYVTEPFAAALALWRDSNLATDYLGQVQLAKGAGVMPLFNLHRKSCWRSGE